MAKNKKVVPLTAAMPDGTGVCTALEQFPDRSFDVGIAEQHCVTFAAGLSVEGLKPVCAIYSTFLQRAFDQLVHDVCIQDLRSEEHTSELQSQSNLVCRLLLEKKNDGEHPVYRSGSIDVDSVVCRDHLRVAARRLSRIRIDVQAR